MGQLENSFPPRKSKYPDKIFTFFIVSLKILKITTQKNQELQVEKFE